MTQQIDPNKQSFKNYVIVAGVAGAVLIGAVAIQRSNVLKVRPASGTASAMAAASSHNSAP